MAAIETSPTTEAPQDAITALVGSGQLRIIHIDAPPRSISSAFQIALAQGADKHTYEPFRRHSNRKDVVEHVSRDLLGLYREAKEENTQRGQPADKPVVIVVKELANFIKDDDFKRWLPMLDGWVSIMRSPNTQIQSFMTRSVLNGAQFSPQQIASTRDVLRAEHGKEPSEYLLVRTLSEDFRVRAGKHTPAGTVMPHKLETRNFDMWGALSRHFDAVQATSIPKAVVDGTVLCADQGNVMGQVANTLNLPYSKKMLAGWETAGGTSLIPQMAPDELKKDAWVTDAVNSRSLVPPQNQPLPLAFFSPTVRRYVEKALEHFQTFANSEHAVLPRSVDEAKRLLTMPVPHGAPFGTNCLPNTAATFETAQPIISYAIVLSMPVTTTDDQKWRSAKLGELEITHKKHYSDSFQIMNYRQRAIEAARTGPYRPEGSEGNVGANFLAAEPAPV